MDPDDQAMNHDGNPAPAELAFGHFLVPRRADGGLWELGRGAMGVTYRAFDTSLRTEVALKVIRAEQVANEDTRRRFQREARAAAKIRHPNVASVLYLGDQGGEFFYAMEFIAGRTLEALIKDNAGPLPPVVAVALAAQAAAALNAAHKREVVHRDLKPGNLMLLEGDALDHEDERTAAAGNRLLKIIDFGLARSFGANRQEDSMVTQTFAGFIGTPAYASPEQCVGGSDLDGRSDLYSLGIILWQMLTGRLPFTGGVVEVLGKHQFQPPPAAQLANVPAPLAALVTGLLAKDPAERQPQTAGLLRTALDRCLRELAVAPTPADVPPVAPDNTERTRDTTVTPTVGTTLLARYRLGREVAEGDGGKLFLAADNTESERPVALKLLPTERLAREPGFREAVETALLTAHQHPHPILLAQISANLERSGNNAFYIREWADGFSLDELLRARHGELRAAEVFRLLDALPAALDFTHAHAFPLVDVALHKLFVLPVVGSGENDWPGLRTRPVTDWPAFALKLNPLGFAPAVQAGTDAPELTRVVSLGHDGDPDAAHPVATLARLTRELLGASADGFGPVAALNGEANAVLQRALAPTAGFADAITFWRTLQQASGISGATEPKKIQESKDSEVTQAEVIRLVPTAPSILVPPFRLSTLLPKRTDLVVTSVLALFALFAAGWWFGFERPLATRQRQEELIQQQRDEAARRADKEDRQRSFAAVRQREEENQQRARAAQQEEKVRQAAAAKAREEQERQAAEQAKQPKAINVPGDYSTIQSALNAARPGDTVLVAAGRYAENLSMTTENVELRGAASDSVIVQQTGKDGNGLLVRGNSSGRVIGMTFEQTRVDKDKNWFPLVRMETNAFELRDCVVRGSLGEGISVTTGVGSAEILIDSCTVEGSQDNGIVVVGGKKVVLQNNVCRKNGGVGILFYGDSIGDLENNTCRENKTDGIAFRSGAGGTVTGNICSSNGNTGITINGANTNLVLSANQCTNNEGWGIYKTDNAKLKIAEDNAVHGNQAGQIGP